jgi:hypothetical protein
LVDSSRIRELAGVKPQHGDQPTAVPLGREFELATVIRPRTDRSSSPMPSGACAVKNARCSLEYRSGMARLPAATSLTSVTSRVAFRDAEQR